MQFFLLEEGGEGVITAASSPVTRHLTVGLDAVLQAVELPAGITDLGSGLSNVHRNNLTLKKGSGFIGKSE